MPRLVNPLSVRPDELRPGDVMAMVVTLHVVKHGDGLAFRMYKCGYPPQVHGGIPQGSRLGDGEREVMGELFPVVGWADVEPDLF